MPRFSTFRQASGVPVSEANTGSSSDEWREASRCSAKSLASEPPSCTDRLEAFVFGGDYTPDRSHGCRTWSSPASKSTSIQLDCAHRLRGHSGTLAQATVTALGRPRDN
jgi:hypothetical protein